MELTLQFIVVTLFIEVAPGPAMLFVLYQSGFGFRYVITGILGAANGQYYLDFNRSHRFRAID